MRRVVEDTQGRHLKLRAYAVGPEANRTYARQARTRPADGSSIGVEPHCLLDLMGSGIRLRRQPDTGAARTLEAEQGVDFLLNVIDVDLGALVEERDPVLELRRIRQHGLVGPGQVRALRLAGH